VKSLIPALVASLIILLVFSSGCTGDILTTAGVGDFGGTTPAPATDTSGGTSSGTIASSAAGTTSGVYAECMSTCKQYVDNGQCISMCCVAGCSEESPGGIEVCIDKCTNGALPASPNSAGTPLSGATQSSDKPRGFACEYDESLLKTSPEFAKWFNTSCYYNDYCGWWESSDLIPDGGDAFGDCINCSADSFSQQPAPTHTPCPARTTKPAPVMTTTSAPVSSGTCGAGLTQCRVFSTDYCVDLMTDVNHCGACRWGCPLPNAENGCSGGKCYIKSCNIGWADCNGIAEDGCEVDLDSDDNNCGKCGRVCSLPNANAICAGEDGDGICEVEWCKSSWLNENGLHEDGCEVRQ